MENQTAGPKDCYSAVQLELLKVEMMEVQLAALLAELKGAKKAEPMVGQTVASMEIVKAG